MKINPAVQALMGQRVDTGSNNKSMDFAKILKDELNKVNDLQVQGDIKNQELLSGESQDIHSVLLKTEEARLSLEMAVQIRNKLIESYQEINRMQL